MRTIEIISVLVTVLAVAGVVLNNRKLRGCFILWMFSNSVCACIHWDAGLYGLMVRDLIFLGLAVEGWKRWGQKK